MEHQLPPEVKIGGTTFIVNRFSREGAKETLDQLLKRAILKNAEKEFRSASSAYRNQAVVCT